mmetsp:Transcript_17439/g.39890  ORF Transcript_17439/g.39890 Transcript_17439/m.39890 type:complete len:324 (-) Transcript_17439:233-1204(-)
MRGAVGVAGRRPSWRPLRAAAVARWALHRAIATRQALWHGARSRSGTRPTERIYDVGEGSAVEADQQRVDELRVCGAQSGRGGRELRVRHGAQVCLEVSGSDVLRFGGGLIAIVRVEQPVAGALDHSRRAHEVRVHLFAPCLHGCVQLCHAGAKREHQGVFVAHGLHVLKEGDRRDETEESRLVVEELDHGLARAVGGQRSEPVNDVLYLSRVVVCGSGQVRLPRQLRHAGEHFSANLRDDVLLAVVEAAPVAFKERLPPRVVAVHGVRVRPALHSTAGGVDRPVARGVRIRRARRGGARCRAGCCRVPRAAAVRVPAAEHLR